MFFVGGLPALLSLFIRARVKEPEAFHEQRTDWPTYKRSLFANWRRFLYLVLLMTIVFIVAVIVIAAGPEAKGTSFRKAIVE